VPAVVKQRPVCWLQAQPPHAMFPGDTWGMYRSMRIASVGCALPAHYYDQDTLLAAFQGLWGERRLSAKLQKFHTSVSVGGRYLALPMDAYRGLSSFTDCNDAYIRCAIELGEQAVADALRRAELAPRDIDHLFFVSVTGVATPSVDARLANRMGLRPHVKRTPIFGLGCVAGATGVARAADYLRAYPDQVAVLLSVELCSLTLQRDDFSVKNIIASGLFGDGAAAVILVGADRSADGPAVVASRSVLYPHTEQAMGWDVTANGFRVVLSAEVPKIVARHIREDVDAFLAECGLTRKDIGSYVCHPGGPKILHAVHRALELPPAALALTWESLKTVGNLSSASVLLVLRDTMLDHRPARGSYGLMMAMGPGFCTELVLLRW
jgi:alkylresorcinol/alkylpyrone synthase